MRRHDDQIRVLGHRELDDGGLRMIVEERLDATRNARRKPARDRPQVVVGFGFDALDGLFFRLGVLPAGRRTRIDVPPAPPPPGDAPVNEAVGAVRG